MTTLEQIAEIVGQTFSVGPETIRAETTAHDVPGWDSVTHVHLLFALEDHFRIELPVDAVMKCRTVAELADLVSRRVEPRPRIATVIVYGNCQAGLIADALNQFASMRERARFHHVLSWEPSIPDEVVASTDLLWQQYAEWQDFPYGDRLPPTCRRILFPSLDFTLLWPFAATNPRNKPEPPNHPFGRYPYGDAVAVQVIRNGLAGEEGARSYAELSRARLARMSADHLEEMEFARWAQRETHCDITMADCVRAHYRSVQIFYTWNHPGGLLLSELMKRLLVASDLWDPDPNATLAAEVAHLAAHWEPFSHFELPIHPMVSELLRLQWLPPDRHFRTPWGPITHEEFIRHYIDGDEP